MKFLQTRELKTAHGHFMPRISICKMDLPALQTIPYLHGNGFMLALVCMDSVLAYGHHGCPMAIVACACLKTMNY